jgi:hypothetical protein
MMPKDLFTFIEEAKTEPGNLQHQNYSNGQQTMLLIRRRRFDPSLCQ